MFVGTERAALRSWESRPCLSATGKPTVRRYTLGTNACPRCQTFSSVNLCTNAPPATYSCCSNGFHLQLLTFNFGPLSCLQDSGFEFADFGIKGGGFEGPDQCVAGVGGIDDGVDPEARGGIARIGLMFVSGADDAAPFRVFADHEAVYVVQKNQWDAVLVAIENEARRFFRGLGINHAAKFDTLLVRAARQCLHVFFLIGDNADGPAANAGVSAKKSFAVLRAVLFELARIDGARDDLLHIVLLRWVAGENPVDVVGGIEWVARFHMAERRSIRCADFVDQRADPRDAGIIIRFAEIHRAADLRVHFRAAEIFGGSFLSDRRLHQRRSRQK